jgi:hypothetical protein
MTRALAPLIGASNASTADLFVERRAGLLAAIFPAFGEAFRFAPPAFFVLFAFFVLSDFPDFLAICASL